MSAKPSTAAMRTLHEYQKLERQVLYRSLAGNELTDDLLARFAAAADAASQAKDPSIGPPPLDPRHIRDWIGWQKAHRPQVPGAPRGMQSFGRWYAPMGAFCLPRLVAEGNVSDAQFEPHLSSGRANRTFDCPSSFHHGAEYGRLTLEPEVGKAWGGWQLTTVGSEWMSQSWIGCDEANDHHTDLWGTFISQVELPGRGPYELRVISSSYSQYGWPQFATHANLRVTQGLSLVLPQPPNLPVMEVSYANKFVDLWELQMGPDVYMGVEEGSLATEFSGGGAVYEMDLKSRALGPGPVTVRETLRYHMQTRGDGCASLDVQASFLPLHWELRLLPCDSNPW